jgi:hypothetical protein
VNTVEEIRAKERKETMQNVLQEGMSAEELARFTFESI